MSLPKVAIDNWVPNGVKKDVRHRLMVLRGKGATQIQVLVPADDMQMVMLDLAPQVGVPFTPYLCETPCEPYQGTIINFVWLPKGAEKKHTLGPDGHEMEVL